MTDHDQTINEETLQQASIEQMLVWGSDHSFLNRTNAAELIGQELMRRIEAGQRKDVLDFLSQLERNNTWTQRKLISSLVRDDRKTAPWQESDELWYQMAEPLMRLGWLPSYSEHCPTRGQKLTTWLRQQAEAEQKLPQSRSSYLWREALELMYWPEISREECLGSLHFAEQAAINTLSEGNIDECHELLQVLPVEDLIELASYGRAEILQASIFDMLTSRARESGYDWTPWLDYFSAHPSDYWEHNLRDALLIEHLWPQSSAARRVDMVDHLEGLLCGRWNKNNQKTATIFERLLQDDPQPFMSYLQRQIEGYSSLGNALIGRLIWKSQSPDLLPLLLPAYAKDYKYADAAEGYDDEDDEEYDEYEYEDEEENYKYNPVPVIQEILAQQPELIATVPGSKVASLLDRLSDEVLNLCLPGLTGTLKSSHSKGLRLFLKSRADALQPEQIEACGWVKKPVKNLMVVARDVLLAHSNPEVGPLLEKLLASGKLDAGSASQVEARLIQLGLREPLSGEAQLQQMETQLVSVKRIGKAVEQAATPDLVAHMSPLSAQAAKAVLQLVYSANEELPPLVHQALSCLSAEQRAKLMPYLLQSWIACDGDPKQRWILRLLKDNADDRLVDLLFDAVRSWNKPRGPRAVMATEHLAEIDSFYALMRVQEISETRRYRDSVIDKARTCLRQAAQRRDMTTDELFDELTPDFGLADEKGFLIGDKSYRIELQGDLTLRVINEKGKATKSVPKPRDAGLLDEWEEAKTQFKVLGSGLKAALKRQRPRMKAALLRSKQWPASRWQRLFVQHPLLQVVGQSLIWQTDGGQSFRISEDRSLVDVNDEAIELTDDQPIRLWHPIHGKEGEREQWQEYLADYELEPMVDQLGAPDQLPTPEQMDDHQILAPQKLTVMQGPLASLLKKLGYRQGPVGDGPRVECHYINLDTAEYYIELHHYDYLPWMDLDHPVTIEGISVSPSTGGYWSQSINPAELPITLQAKLLDHLKQIEALV